MNKEIGVTLLNDMYFSLQGFSHVAKNAFSLTVEIYLACLISILSSGSIFFWAFGMIHCFIPSTWTVCHDD